MPDPLDVPASSYGTMDSVNAKFFDQAGDRVSGLDLSEIGLDGHAVANTLWRISAYLAKRAGMGS